MELIFRYYWMEIFKDEDKYVIRYDSGDLFGTIAEIVVSEQDAILAQVNEKEAEKVILHYMNIASYGEDYLERRKQKP